MSQTIEIKSDADSKVGRHHLANHQGKGIGKLDV